MAEEYYIHLTSLENTDIYHNTASAFQNNIPALHLNVKIKYEMALLNMLVPRKINALIKDDEHSSINFYGTFLIDESETEHIIYTFTPKQDILSRDVRYMVSELNRQIKTDM